MPREKRAHSGEKEAKQQLALMMKAVELLREGRPSGLSNMSSGLPSSVRGMCSSGMMRETVLFPFHMTRPL